MNYGQSNVAESERHAEVANAFGRLQDGVSRASIAAVQGLGRCDEEDEECWRNVWATLQTLKGQVETLSNR